MNTHRIVGSALAFVAFVLAAEGCMVDNTASSEDRICTPGAYVFCRCADRAEGTKLCKDDGKSFEACTTGAGGECQGGEIDDPNTGKPVDDTGHPVEQDAGTKPGPAVDQCPGKIVALTPGVDTVLEDDTTGASDSAKGAPGACAVGSGGPDHVYHLQPKGSGQLSIKVEGTKPLDPTVYVRTTCDDEATQVRCSETTPAGGVEQTSTNVLTGKDYFLYVDGASGTAGKYKVTLHLTTGAFCGDGKVDTNEACDDTNHVDGDGCSADCRRVEGDPASANGCPGQPVHVWPGRKVTGSGSTNPFGNAFTKTGSSCIVSNNDLNAAQDHVYQVTAHGAGNLVVTATPSDASYNLELVARATCTDPASQGADMCANLASAGGAETMTFPVSNGQTVAVAVDGVLNAKGAYTISFELK